MSTDTQTASGDWDPVANVPKAHSGPKGPRPRVDPKKGLVTPHDDTVDPVSWQPKPVVPAKKEDAHRVHIPFVTDGKGYNPVTGDPAPPVVRPPKPDLSNTPAGRVASGSVAYDPVTNQEKPNAANIVRSPSAGKFKAELAKQNDGFDPFGNPKPADAPKKTAGTFRREIQENAAAGIPLAGAASADAALSPRQNRRASQDNAAATVNTSGKDVKASHQKNFNIISNADA